MVFGSVNPKDDGSTCTSAIRPATRTLQCSINCHFIGVHSFVFCVKCILSLSIHIHTAFCTAQNVSPLLTNKALTFALLSSSDLALHAVLTSSNHLIQGLSIFVLISFSISDSCTPLLNRFLLIRSTCTYVYENHV